MRTRPLSELRDSVMASWSDETHEFHQKAAAYFEDIATKQAEIGASVTAARKLRKLTQQDLQELSGVNQAEISRIESGQANPTEETLIKLTSALKFKIQLIPAEDLIPA
jgi:ribosome-binding protein aMBF1 (putative translation factor)